MVKNRKITTDSVMDPYALLKGPLPWSGFYAVYEQDEVALFWTSVFGGATVGTFIGTTLGAGGYTAFGGHSAHFILQRFAPIGAIVTSTQLQHFIGEEAGIEHEVAINYAATGGFTSAMPVVTSQDTSSPTGGFTWESIMSLF